MDIFEKYAKANQDNVINKTAKASNELEKMITPLKTMIDKFKTLGLPDFKKVCIIDKHAQCSMTKFKSAFIELGKQTQNSVLQEIKMLYDAIEELGGQNPLDIDDD